MIRARGMLFFSFSVFFILPSIAQAGRSCGFSCPRLPAEQARIQNCDQIQAYRKQMAEQWSQDQRSITFDRQAGCTRVVSERAGSTPCVECAENRLRDGSARLDHEADFFKNTLCSMDISMSGSDKRTDLGNGMVLLGRDAVRRAEEKKQNDIRAMMRFYDSHPEWQKITSQEMRDASNRFVNHVRSIEARMGRGTNPETKRSLRSSVVPGMVVEVRDEQVGLSDIAIQKWMKENEALNLSGQESARFQQLLESAKAPNQGQKGMSPYIARMILLFHLEKKVEDSVRSGRQSLTPAQRLESRKQLNVLAQELSLKYRPFPGSADWDSVLPHDGYLYGASRTDAQQLVQQNQKADSTEGIDCSVFVQQVLEGAGFSGDWFKKVSQGSERTTTRSMLSWKNQKTTDAQGKTVPVFDTATLCDERQLKPGDIIVRTGHTYIFSGYELINGKYEMKILEATGGRNQSLRETTKPLYDPSSSCQRSQWTNAFDSSDGLGGGESCFEHQMLRVQNIPKN